MPITNNFIQIDDQSLRPVPKFSITYETFRSGEYVIGGILKLTLTGEIYGSSASDLSTKIRNLSAYSGTCKDIYISCDSEILINDIGFIKNVTINPTDQPFMVNYTLEIEISNKADSIHVKRDVSFGTLLNITIPEDINLKSYEETISIVGDDSMSNSGFYGGGIYTKSQLKLSGSISIQAHHHMCENNSSIISDLYTVLENRFSAILSLSSSISTAYPSIASYCNGDYTAVHDNKNFSVNKIDNKLSVQFDMYLIPNLPLNAYPTSVVDLTIAENTDQTTGFSNLSVRGSIRGLSNKTTSILDNKVLSSEKLSNARNAYSSIVDALENREYAQFIILGCYNGSLPPSDICYNRISSQITENLNGGEITFDLSYGDIQSCQIGGANIDVNITEDFPTYRYVEHIIPGIEYPIVQIGTSQTAMKISMTVSGKLNGCDTTKIPDLINCVDGRATLERNNRGYNGYILQSQTKTLGKYSYKVVENYIGFDPVNY